MTKEELDGVITEVRASVNDEGKLSESLLKLQSMAQAEIETGISVQKELGEVKAKNGQLLESNMALFLRVGNITNTDTNNKGQTEKREFSELFNENGRLK